MAEQLEAAGTVFLMMILDFKKMAVEFRKIFSISDNEKFPALHIAENGIYEKDGDFEFNIVSDSDWHFKDSVQAYYRHSSSKHEIGIRESVYQKALGGDKNALVSIAHEISHWALINCFEVNFGIDISIPPAARQILIGIHENLTDLLTSLLIFPEDKLMSAKSAEEIEDSSCMSGEQIDLALFYCQNYKILQENFIRNILPQIERQIMINERKEEENMALAAEEKTSPVPLA